MTVRVAGSRFKCKDHAGEALVLSSRSKGSNVPHIGTPRLDDGARDLPGSFLILFVGAHTHPPPLIITSTSCLLLTAPDVRQQHHVSLVAQKEDVPDKLADVYGRVTATVPQTALRYARRQAAAGRHPWGQGHDAALQMVARAVTARDSHLRAPVVSAEMGYIFPSFFESNVRRVANGVLALETDECCKAGVGGACTGRRLFCSGHHRDDQQQRYDARPLFHPARHAVGGTHVLQTVIPGGAQNQPKVGAMARACGAEAAGRRPEP